MSSTVHTGRLRKELFATALLILLGIPTAAFEIGSSPPKAVILGVEAIGRDGADTDDVRVQLAWAASGPASSARVDVEDRQGTIVASKSLPGATAPDDSSSFKVNLDNVLTAETIAGHGWSYRVFVRNFGGTQDLAESFPFHVSGCLGSFFLVPGLSTDAVVVSPELDQALDGGGHNLQGLAANHPELACEIDQLEAQLDSLAGTSQNACYWQVVVKSDTTTLQDAFEVDGVYFKGIVAGASHCFSARVDGTTAGSLGALPDPSAPPLCDPDQFTPTTSRLDFEIRCRDSSGELHPDCDGKLQVDATLKVIAEAHVHDPQGFGDACGYERMDLLVDDGHGGFSLLAEAVDGGGQVSDDGDAQKAEGTFAAAAGQPSSLVLRATGGAVLTPTGVPLYAEYGNVYAIETVATSECTVQPQFQIDLKSPDFLTARQGYVTMSVMATLKAIGGIKDPDW